MRIVEEAKEANVNDMEVWHSKGFGVSMKMNVEGKGVQMIMSSQEFAEFYSKLDDLYAKIPTSELLGG